MNASDLQVFRDMGKEIVRLRAERDKARQMLALHLLEYKSTPLFARRAKSGSFQQNT